MIVLLGVMSDSIISELEIPVSSISRSNVELNKSVVKGGTATKLIEPGEPEHC